MHNMQKTLLFHEKYETYSDSTIFHFTLTHLLPEDHLLVLNEQIHVLSLLASGPSIITQQQLTINEMRVVAPILKSFPQYCPYEVLLLELFADVVTPTSLHCWQQRLNRARSLGTWQQEMRPLRRTLSSLRAKLRTFDLEISTVREMGCSITRLTPLPIPLTHLHNG
jgi:hypothetical protein